MFLFRYWIFPNLLLSSEKPRSIIPNIIGSSSRDWHFEYISLDFIWFWNIFQNYPFNWVLKILMTQMSSVYAINISVYLSVISGSDWHLSHLVWKRRSRWRGGSTRDSLSTIFNYTDTGIFDSNISTDEQK